MQYGAVHFERKYWGRLPSATRLALRFAARWARWLPGLLRLGPTLATVKLLAELADWWGQVEEVRRLRCL